MNLLKYASNLYFLGASIIITLMKNENIYVISFINENILDYGIKITSSDS